MSWWYPKFNYRGDVASGNGTIWVNGKEVKDRDGAVVHGHSPHWYTDDIIFTSGEERKSYLLNIRTGERTTLPFEFNGRVSNISALSAGLGHWCGWGPGSGSHGLYLDGHLIDAGATPGVIDSETGWFSYLTPYQANVRDIIVNGTKIRTTHATELTGGERWLCWQDFSSGTPRAWGWTPEQGMMELSPLPLGEFSFLSEAVRTPNGLWVATGTHRGVIIHAWGGYDGYILEQEFFYPDAAWLNGRFVLVGTDSRGNLLRHEQDLSHARYDLRTYRPTTGGPVDPPPPPPNGEEPVPYKRQSPDYKSKVVEFANAHPALFESARERPDGSRDPAFIEKLASWMHAKVDPKIGLNGKRGTNTKSTDALSYLNPTGPGGVEVIDVLTGSHRIQWSDATIPPGHPNHPNGVLGKYIEPQPWIDNGEPPPPPPDDCEKRLTVVTAELNAARTEIQLCRNEIEGLVAEIERLKNLPPPPPPPCRCQIEGPGWAIRLFGITCRPL